MINFLSSPQFGQATQMLASALGTGSDTGGLNSLYQIGGPSQNLMNFWRNSRSEANTPAPGSSLQRYWGGKGPSMKAHKGLHTVVYRPMQAQPLSVQKCS